MTFSHGNMNYMGQINVTKRSSTFFYVLNEIFNFLLQIHIFVNYMFYVPMFK